MQQARERKHAILPGSHPRVSSEKTSSLVFASPFCFSLPRRTLISRLQSRLNSSSISCAPPGSGRSVSGFYICRFLQVALLLSLSAPVRPRGDGESISARSWTSRFADELSIAPTSNPKRAVSLFGIRYSAHGPRSKGIICGGKLYIIVTSSLTFSLSVLFVIYFAYIIADFDLHLIL